MKRSVKVTALVAGAVVAGSLVTGIAVASTATQTTTHPITLCVGKLGGGVTKPGGSGSCNKLLQTTIHVASADDVAALAARADAIEANQTADASAIAALQAASTSDESSLAALANLDHGQITIIATPSRAPGKWSLTVSARGLAPDGYLDGEENATGVFGSGSLGGMGWTGPDYIDSHGMLTATAPMHCVGTDGTFTVFGTSADDNSKVTSNTVETPC